MKCPICDKGNLKKGTVKEVMFGTYLGDFPAQICDSCGESYTDQETTRNIEKIAKAKGIWGLGKKTTIAKTGNSLAVRIPKEIASYLHVSEGMEVYIHPDKEKIVIECSKRQGRQQSP
ncbi:AbrB/MazE/SpoVT family DNA-binding domain-containing protein [Candidatus Woesearchaeota archaeon]|nr:AbrB/MazE/SpoVT family DNA-binding domain-containing protein [Candidatus Woesearchaeota archaeon]